MKARCVQRKYLNFLDRVATAHLRLAHCRRCETMTDAILHTSERVAARKDLPMPSIRHKQLRADARAKLARKR